LAGSADFDLYRPSEEHDMLRDAVRSLAEAKIAPHAAAVDEEARFPQEALEALAANDLHAVHVPEEYGGSGADALATVIVIEEVARVCASSSLIPAVNKLGSLPVILSGSEDLKKRYMTPLAKGDGMFSYCLSEPDAGSDAAGMKTKAVRDGDHYVLNGVKRWITNAGESEFYTVMAVTDPAKRSKGISAFVVEKSDEGVSFGAPEKKLGGKGSPTREEYLDHTRILADFQGIQFMLADMAMKISAARALTYQAAAASERGDADLTYLGAAAKCFASDAAMEVTTDAVQLLGGYGYTRDYPVERMMRDAKITQIYEGTNQVQRIVMARNLP
jgi:alkylation response protein AidB-like acyl-CoA dehydrogenase